MESADAAAAAAAAVTLDSVDVVGFHAPCTDGSAAAAVIWHALSPARRAAVRFVGLVHSPNAKTGTELGDVDGKRVLLVDYCFPRAALQCVLAQAAGLLVLDHHATAAAEVAGLASCDARLSATQCGAVLAAEWAGLSPDSPLWPALALVQDEDLGLWSHGAVTEHYTVGLPKPLSRGTARDSKLRAWEAALLQPVDALVARGLPRCEYRAELTAAATAKARLCQLAAFPTLRCALLNETTFRNEAARALLQDVRGSRRTPRFDVVLAFAVALDGDGDEERRDGRYVVSARSREGVDCSAIAQHYCPSAGGHPRAAGFVVSARTSILEALSATLL